MFGKIEDKKTKYAVLFGLVLLLASITAAVVFGLKLNAMSVKFESSKSEMTSLREEVYEDNQYIEYLENQAQNDTAYKNLLTDYEELEKVNNSNATLIEGKYKKIGTASSNPIDNFFEKNYINSYATTTYVAREQLREQAWKEEMENSYKRVISLAGSERKAELEKSLEIIHEYVENEKYLYLMTSHGTQGAVEIHSISAEIYKNRTFELNDIIKGLGAEEKYIFNSSEYLSAGSNIFLTESYYKQFYKVAETGEGFKITLYDLDKNVIQEVTSTSTPVVKYQNFGILVVKVQTREKVQDVYEFNTYNADVEKYQNVLYYENGVKVIIDGDEIVLSEGYGTKEVRVTRDWKNGKPETAINSIEVYTDENYANILRLKYTTNGSNSDVVEFIKFS